MDVDGVPQSNLSNYENSKSLIEKAIKELEVESEAIKKKISLLKDKLNLLTTPSSTNALPAGLEFKILEYQFRESIITKTFFDFYSVIGLVCKRWYYQILPKLLSIQPIFKNDDLLYTYLKVRDLCKEFLNRRTVTPYQLGSEKDITNLFRTLYVPSVSTGCCKINLEKNPQEQTHYQQSSRDYKIYINQKECGTIFNPDITQILQNANPAKFGKGTELVFDEAIRKGLSISGDIIDIPFLLDTAQFIPNTSFELHLSKIHIYQEGGKFEEHIDTIRDKNHVGTFIFPLGTAKYEGGEFIVSETQSLDPKDESTLVYRIEGTNVNENNYDFNWILFYNDCLHKVSPVTKGIRIVVQFNVHYTSRNNNQMCPRVYGENSDLSEGNGYPIETITYDRKSQYLTYNNSYIIEYLKQNSDILEKLSIKLNKIMKEKKVNVGLFLNHLYKAHINKNHLKGVDLDIWNGLVEHFGESRLKISPFLITENTIREGNWSRILKIDIINSSTINQSFNSDTTAHTLLYCGSKYSNLKSIHSKELPSTGNEERYHEDVGCFSAIIIQKECVETADEPKETKKLKLSNINSSTTRKKINK